MASISSLSSLSSSSANFSSLKLPSDRTHSLAASRVSLRPLRVSASCATTAERPSTRIAAPGSFYDVLGVQMGATCGEIKAAYRKLARVFHPDVAAEGQKENRAYEFIKIHEAYETLSDPDKRADYDRSFYRRGWPMSSPFVTSATVATAASYAASGFSGFTRRRWETDQCW